MSGRQNISLFVFLYYFLEVVVGLQAAAPIMHSIPLQNWTGTREQFNDLPLVAKCCKPNEVLVADETKLVCKPGNSNMGNFSPLFSEFNRTGVLVPGDEQERFVAIIGDPCTFLRFMLSPEESDADKNYLLLNGSVFAPYLTQSMLMPGIDYCMDVAPGRIIRTLVCSDKDAQVTIADVRITLFTCGLLISVPFLILTILAYLITPRLRDVLGIILCHYCGCLAFAFSSLAFVQLGSHLLSNEFCTCIAFIIQFSFVACFFWLNVMCMETWALIRSHFNRDRYTRIEPKRLFMYYSLWGWGSPVILILLSLAMDLNPTIPATYIKSSSEQESCWLKPDNKAMPYFYIPVGLLMTGNIIFFVMTFIKLKKHQQEITLRRLARNSELDRIELRLLRRLKRTFFCCVALFFLMGVSWTIELIFWILGGNPFSQTIFDLVSVLQGIFVFSLFVLRKPLRNYVWHRIQKLRGVNVPEPEIPSMDVTLLPMINGDYCQDKR